MTVPVFPFLPRRVLAIAQTAVLSLVAWFGARALCELAVPQAAARAAMAARAPAAHARSGPIPRRTDILPLPPGPAASRSLPLCRDVELRVASVSGDPRRSLATLRVAGQPAAAPHRIGDRVGQRTLVGIGYDGRHATPVAVLAGQGRACRVGLGAGPARPAAGTAARTVIPSGTPGVRALLHGLHFVADHQGGVRLFGVGSGSVLSMIGIDNGDRIESVNGLSLVDPVQALQLYCAPAARARAAGSGSSARGRP